MGYRNDDVLVTDGSAILHEAASSGFESVEELLRLLSSRRSRHSPPSTPPEMEIDADAGTAVSRLRKMISLLGRNRTGHARFRRAPVPIPVQKPPVPADPSEISRVYYATPIQQIPPPQISHHRHAPLPQISHHRHAPPPATIDFSYSSATNSFVSSLTAGGDVESNRRHAPSPSFWVSRPPEPACSLKRKCSSENIGSGGKCGGSSGGRCHCSKKRKLRSRKVVRVPAISLKLADIPPDDYSWRKYGQKPIKGSPHPRGYYKCSSVRGCPARKHVERAVDDPGMLVVTYEGEHNHSMAVAEVGSHILESS